MHYYFTPAADGREPGRVAWPAHPSAPRANDFGITYVPNAGGRP
ncbi:MAG: hypothetical protein ACRYFK_03640 [Janthinobacterium lividum]